MKYNIVPVSKPRMTQRDKWRQRPSVMKYRAFKDEIRAAGIELLESGQHVTFIIPMPKSWNEKKRLEHDGKPHKQRPDIDNLQKALLDAVTSEDCYIWDMRCTKVWGATGAMEIVGKP